MSRVALLISLIAFLSVLLTGCHGDDSNSEVDNEDPTELYLAIGGEPEDGFDPTLGWGRYGSPLFHSTLLRLDPHLNIVEDLATDYWVSDDGLTWTVTIRDDVLFHDGTPVTASDVAFTYEQAVQSGGLVDVQAFSHARVINEFTVALMLHEPRSNFTYQMTTLGIVPKEAHDVNYKTRPIGSGPFTFVQWDPGQQLIVKRNDDYYGDSPEFEQLTFLFSDEDGALAATRTNLVHLAGVRANLAGMDIPGYRLKAVPSLDNRGISFPFLSDTGGVSRTGTPVGNDVTSNLALRQAINYAIDRAALVSGVLDGYGSPATGPADEAPWHEPRSVITDNDPDRAKSILGADGWAKASDGVLAKDGLRAEFALLYPASDPLRQALAVAVSDQLRPLGIRILPEGVSWHEISDRMHTDAVVFGWGSHDPIEAYYIYSSGMAGVDHFNPGYYGNPTVEGHFQTALSALAPEKALQAWQDAQLDAHGNGYSTDGDAAWAWLVNVDHTYYVDDCLDLGALQTEPHGHGWPITAGITGWTWTC